MGVEIGKPLEVPEGCTSEEDIVVEGQSIATIGTGEYSRIGLTRCLSGPKSGVVCVCDGTLKEVCRCLADFISMAEPFRFGGDNWGARENVVNVKKICAFGGLQRVTNILFGKEKT